MLLATLLVLLPVLAALAAPPAGADAVSVAEARLPERRWGAAAAWHAGKAYVLGGFHNGLARPDIARVDLATGESVFISEKLPAGFGYAGSAWTGSVLYLVGGKGNTESHVVRFDPATETAAVVASLPGPREGASAAFDPRSTAACPVGCVYAFGGRYYDEAARKWTHYDQVLRFEPQSATVQVMAAKLPGPRYYTSAVFDGGTFWIFGGQDQLVQSRDTVFRYDPVADVAALSTPFPTTIFHTAAVWTGDRALVFGGRGFVGGEFVYYDSIYSFDPATETMDLLPLPLPRARWAVAPLLEGDRVWLFGGFGLGPGQMDEILRYDLHLPMPPRGLAAAAGPALGEITLTWDPAHHHADDDVLTYRVHRRTGNDPWTPVADVGTATAYTETGLPQSVLWEYRATSVNAHGEGPVSASVRSYAAGLPAPPVAPRTSPGPGAGQVTVLWDPPTYDGGTPVTGYRVYGLDGATWTLLGTIGASPRSLADSGLANGASRDYRVTALNSAGEGSPSAVVTGTAPVPPGPPRGVQAQTGLMAISVRWSSPAADGGTAVTGYRVYRTPEGSDAATLVADLAANARGWTDDGRGHGHSYTYRVTARNGAGEGEASLPSSASAVGPLSFKAKGGPTNFVIYEDRDDDNVVDDGEDVVRAPVLP